MSDRTEKAFRIVDQWSAQVVGRLAKKGTPVSCGRGCSYCCHLMVEVTWDEAVVLARWVLSRPTARRVELRKRIARSAAERRRFFAGKKTTAAYAKPTTTVREIPNKAADEYFYGRSRPCPFLENNCCTAYPVRPTACRMHLVVSDPELCSRKSGGNVDWEIPELVDKMRERLEPRLTALTDDCRWGELSIMVDSALCELEGRPAPRVPRPSEELLKVLPSTAKNGPKKNGAEKNFQPKRASAKPLEAQPGVLSSATGKSATKRSSRKTASTKNPLLDHSAQNGANGHGGSRNPSNKGISRTRARR